jgi:cellulase/cellobiase CelA1
MFFGGPSGAGFALRDGLSRFLVLAACVLVTACASSSRDRPATRTAVGQTAADRRSTLSQWPDPANYTTIVIAAKVRNQALHLRPWNEKAYAAQLALRTLMTLAGTMRAGKCADFVNHIFDELMDLSQAYRGEKWKPMFVVVAHDPSVASQCAAPRAFDRRPRFRPPVVSQF